MTEKEILFRCEELSKNEFGQLADDLDEANSMEAIRRAFRFIL